VGDFVEVYWSRQSTRTG